ncbi:MAG: ParB/RepB/Spo0J family partition protein [Proteobacteria bacterium]|nr:ParB/RepB/Spo0J family partition protein [Pseudomonadota bacterium]
MSESGGESGRRRGLAKGLSALLGDDGADVLQAAPGAGPQVVPVELVRPSRFQPRRRFDDGEIRELAQSIGEQGVLQPLVVRRDPEIAGSYEIVAGERRWRAAQLAQLHQLPVIVRDVTDREALEISLVENVQREDLTALEEAQGYKRLIDDFGHTHDALAKAVGKSRSHMANTLRLLGLPEPVKAMLDDGKLTAGHARALLAAPDPTALGREVVARGLNVRQTERLVRSAAHPRRRARATTAQDVDTRAIARSLSDRLGLTVKVKHRRVGGWIEIRYRTLEQLDDILRRLGATVGRTGS